MLPFTGGLLLGTHFIHELYAHMGFQQAWKYRRVVELQFDEGRLVAERDLSDEAATFRARLTADDVRPAGLRGLWTWVRRSFSREYAADAPFSTWRHPI